MGITGEIQKILQERNTEFIYKPLTAEEREKHNAETFNASPGDLHTVDGYECKICHNKGMIMKAVLVRDGYWTTSCTPCQCMKTRNTIRRMLKSGLKDVIKKYTFANYEATADWQRKLKDAAMQYANAPSGWFFIGGQSGAGKSHLCTAICREFLYDGKDVLYMLWQDESVKLNNAVNDGEEYARLINPYKTCKVLYIDDLFKPVIGRDGAKLLPTGADVKRAFEILNYRSLNPELLTIISSEYTVNGIIEIDEATGGRIFERAKAFSLNPDRNKNYRLRGVTEL